MTFNVESVPSVSAPSSESYTAGDASSFSVNTSGVPSPSLSLSGSVPGMGLSGTTFSGTPTTAGTYMLTFTVSNDAGSASATVTVTVSSPAPPPPTPKASLASSQAPVNAGVASVSVRCVSAACSGKVALTSSGKSVGSASFTITANTTSTVRLVLNAEGRKLIAASKRHRIGTTATLTVTDGPSTSGYLLLAEPQSKPVVGPGSTTVSVTSSTADVSLRCTVVNCAGTTKLELKTVQTTKVGSDTTTKTIITPLSSVTSYSIKSGGTATVKVALNATGRSDLKAAKNHELAVREVTTVRGGLTHVASVTLIEKT